MATKIFVNLPVRDLQKSIDFFTHLGFSFNPQFTNHEAACLVLGDNIYAMLLTHERFADFTKKKISDATQSTEVLLCLDAESREAVDTMVQRALEAGGSRYADPMDHGWMYAHSFADPDGHQWEIAFMDEAALQAMMQESGAGTAAQL
ncbi:VOC family protein [Flaviaesturariibacter amylovorans]|uniref:VOC family protein n=1 Tax=Flaviaesturariibacter amylovorans TaxID=1084520 RepID=A0ABP8GTI7_9BACT